MAEFNNEVTIKKLVQLLRHQLEHLWAHPSSDTRSIRKFLANVDGRSDGHRFPKNWWIRWSPTDATPPAAIETASASKP